MEHVIVTEPAKNLRAFGRQALAGNWGKAAGAIILMTLCMQIPILLMDSFFGKDIVRTYEYAGQSITVTLGRASALSGLFTILVAGAFALGIAKFFLALIRKQGATAGQVFSGFENFGKAFLLMLLYSIFVFLWTLLLIVPGIIAAFRYSQAFYILADKPDTGVMDCLRFSKAMMRDNKFKLFCVELSFIGWLILAAIPTGIVSGAFAAYPLAGNGGYFVTNLILLLAEIGTFFVTAYMMSTTTIFYEILTGKEYGNNVKMMEGSQDS